jgi:hypothetical protein
MPGLRVQRLADHYACLGESVTALRRAHARDDHAVTRQLPLYEGELIPLAPDVSGHGVDAEGLVAEGRGALTRGISHVAGDPWRRKGLCAQRWGGDDADQDHDAGDRDHAAHA